MREKSISKEKDSHESELFPNEILLKKDPTESFNPDAADSKVLPKTQDKQNFNEGTDFHTAPLFIESNTLVTKEEKIVNVKKVLNKETNTKNTNTKNLVSINKYSQTNFKNANADPPDVYNRPKIETENSDFAIPKIVDLKTEAKVADGQNDPKVSLHSDSLSSDCLFEPETIKNAKEIIDLTKDPLENAGENKEVKELEWAIEESLKNNHPDYDAIEPKAMKFPFELDNFQKQAIVHLDKGESVFVAAHTSSGKTVVAEYAIALSISHLTKAIYTSPIKTLSNQKFRDFKKTFGDVGIVTGDVSINPEASCLILTTEIFRSILYKGSEIIRDIEWVIFDEVHYINDYERGVVWEEVIIMLPEHINIILLSATVPNALEFANWVGMIKRKKISVVSTTKRPVPLKHYIWSNKKLFCVKENEKVKQNAFSDIKKHYKSLDPEKLFKKWNEKWMGNNDLVVLLNNLSSKNQIPVVIFLFSKKKCDSNASLLSQYDYNNKNEKGKINLIMEQALKRLSGNDKKLPQIFKIRNFLENGVGVHHSGLLPIVKEVVEMCFARGLVKILFATETFALGVNMPARTVIFEDYNKHDGRSFRPLEPAEYIQMSGRAGRRGLDSFGTVIVMTSNKPDEEITLSQLLTSKPAKLSSKFRVTYNMILNLFKSEDTNVVEVIKKSFDQFHSQREQSSYVASLNQNIEKLKALSKEESNEIKLEVLEYLKIRENLINHIDKITSYLTQSKNVVRHFAPGKLLLLKDNKSVKLTPSVLLRVVFDDKKDLDKKISEKMKLVCLSFVNKKPKENENLSPPTEKYSTTGQFVIDSGDNEISQFYTIRSILLSEVFTLSAHKIRIKDVHQIMFEHDERKIRKVHSMVEKLLNSKSNKRVIKDFLSKVNSTTVQMSEFLSETNALDKKLNEFDFHCNTEFIDQFFEEITQQLKLKNEVKKFEFLLSDANIFLIEVFEKKIEVLKQLGFIAADRSVMIKGRVACEISSANSLILTEAIFENLLSDISPEDILSLISCLIFQYSTNSVPSLTEVQQKALIKLAKIARRIGSVQEDLQVDCSAETFLEENINPGLMQVVFHWAKGDDFRSICSLTDVHEGSIVRNIIRLDETCRDIKNAARVIGDPELYRKMETASSLIKRDIVFTASLYLI